MYDDKVCVRWNMVKIKGYIRVNKISPKDLEAFRKAGIAVFIIGGSTYGAAN